MKLSGVDKWDGGAAKQGPETGFLVGVVLRWIEKHNKTNVS